MLRKILPGLLLSSLCVTALASESPTIVKSHIGYAGAEKVTSTDAIFTQAGRYNVVCTLEKALQESQYINVSYYDNGSPSPVLSDSFSSKKNSISINNVLVSGPATPIIGKYAVTFDYTTSRDFGYIPADCTYTLQAAS